MAGRGLRGPAPQLQINHSHVHVAQVSDLREKFSAAIILLAPRECAPLCPAFGFLCIHYGDGGNVHDLVDFRTALQDMYWLRKTHQDGPDRVGAPQSRQQLVGDVSGFEIRKDQDVRAPLSELKG